MDLWRCSTRVSRHEKIINEVIKDRINVKIQILILFKQKIYNGMDTQKEWHRKGGQGELWNGAHQEEGKEEDPLTPG